MINKMIKLHAHRHAKDLSHKLNPRADPWFPQIVSRRFKSMRQRQ